VRNPYKVALKSRSGRSKKGFSPASDKANIKPFRTQAV
jgi:hypothetical protein